ncbi:MAG TPA: hypothetical protein VGT99_10495 [Gammaproteobacteria bacterium]|nr:hypothetical protein [Gammaproteobacteria bacterium]
MRSGRPWVRFLVFRLCLSMLSGCMGPAAASDKAAVDLERIVANNETAVQAGTDTSQIKAVEVDLDIREANSDSEAIYRADRQGRMRIDIYSGGKRVYTEAYDGHQGWDWGKAGSAPTVDRYAAALWHGTQFPGQIFGLQDMAALGHKLEYIGREIVAGVDYYVLKLTLSDGFETYRYINPDTWLIERGRDFRSFHPARNHDRKTWIETVWSDYRPVQGVRRSFLSVNTDLGSGQWQATNTIHAIKINPTLDPAIFKPPAVPAM